MVIRISDKTQNYSKVTKLLVKPKDNHVLEKSDDYEKRINKQRYSQLLH